jgi:hypothetical protein
MKRSVRFFSRKEAQYRDIPHTYTSLDSSKRTSYLPDPARTMHRHDSNRQDFAKNRERSIPNFHSSSLRYGYSMHV